MLVGRAQHAERRHMQAGMACLACLSEPCLFFCVPVPEKDAFGF